MPATGIWNKKVYKDAELQIRQLPSQIGDLFPVIVH